MEKKILFIEDDRLFQKTLGQKLRAEGFNVISAFSGQEGLNKAQKEKPDLILLDLILPKMTGLEILKELKENDSTKGIKVVILTNVSSEIERIQKSMELGATAYLIKSEYSLEELVKKIKEFLK
ncbi:MAG: response regulator [Minisyncoccales bacterium]